MKKLPISFLLICTFTALIAAQATSENKNAQRTPETKTEVFPTAGTIAVSRLTTQIQNIADRHQKTTSTKRLRNDSKVYQKRT